MSNRRSVAFVGLGNMGGRMAARYVAAGIRVVGYDADAERSVATGVELVPTLEAALSTSDVILLSLPDSRVVEAVVLGDGGIVRHGRVGQTVIDLGTSAPASTIRLAAKLAERRITLIDAGISGGAAAAERGALTLMVGGDDKHLSRIRWVFEPIAQRVVHMGATGAGHSTKLLNNFLNAVSLAATSEVMIAARLLDLDLAKALEVFNHGSGVNFATLHRFPQIVAGDYLEGGLTNALMMKDLRLYLDHMREIGAPTLNAAGPVACFGLADSLGYADMISNRVVDALGDLAGGVRLHSDHSTTRGEPGE